MFPTIIRTFTPQKCKIVTTNWIYDKALYFQLLTLPKPLKFYTIQDGVGGEIFQVWLLPQTEKHLEGTLNQFVFYVEIFF